MFFTKKIQHAINIAAVCHRTYERIGLNLPYIVHPYSVALIVSQYTSDEDTFCAALLHDVIEDSDKYDLATMQKEFGDKITLFVRSITEDKTYSDTIEELRNNWEFRKQKYLNGLTVAPHESLLICAADSIHNLQSLMQLKENRGEQFYTLFSASLEKKMGFYGKIVKKLQQLLDSPITQKLESVYEEAHKKLL